VHTFWDGKPEWKRPFGQSGYRWKDNVKMDLALNFSRLGQGPMVGYCENGNELSGFIKREEFFG
jgi:hypothetical protein